MNSRIIRIHFVILLCFNLVNHTYGQDSLYLVDYDKITTGADQIFKYTPQLKNKQVALVANHSSLIGKTHLVDTLTSLNINIKKIFCPEHGFRGTEDAGKSISNDFDLETGIPIISLYGSHKKPTIDDLKGIDIILFDLQDVGTRFYTYISTLTYIMESCAENRIPLIVLDRPNPNGYYVDGPVLEKEFESFVGLHPVPVVYGMTIGEYSAMVKNEKWIESADSLQLKIIELLNYSHNMIVKLKTKPSPNLPNWESVYLYPSMCFFEGTNMSVGRGTNTPFQIYGQPNFENGDYTFIPQSNIGASNPKYNRVLCNGFNLTDYAHNYNSNPKSLNLSWLINSYVAMGSNNEYFNNYFNKLAGNEELKKQIIEGKTESEIKKSWQDDINKFLAIRAKYLIYD